MEYGPAQGGELAMVMAGLGFFPGEILWFLDPKRKRVSVG
jgi:hypothetical protein